MNCKQLQRELAADPEAQLDAAAQEHLATCEDCQILRDDLLLLREVAQEGTPALPAGFELDLRRRLYQADDDKQRAPQGAAATTTTRIGLVLALAATVVLILGGGLLARYWLDSASPQRVDPPGTYHQLRLVVQAQAEVDVRFDLELPPGVQLLRPIAATLGRGRHPGWQSRLKPGTNLIELPLQALSGAQERPVVARLTVGQRVYRTEVSLNRATAQWTSEVQAPRLAWVLEGVSP